MSYNSYSNYQRPSFFGGFQYFPPVIKALLLSNAGIHIALGLLGAIGLSGLDRFIGEYVPLYPLGDGFYPWQLVTYMFMHGGFMHLLFNMIALWMFGMELENIWGAKKFLTYYLLCGVGAGLSNLLIAPLFTDVGPTVGASGAIYGILIAFGMMFPERPIFVYLILPIRAKFFVLIYVLLEVYFGVTGTADGVAHFAHLGGAAVGCIYILIDQRRVPWQGAIDRLRSRMKIVDPTSVSRNSDSGVTDAKYHDIRNRDDMANQQRIDDILDKISQRGYQSLSEEEKRILFEASKKLN